MENSLKLVKEQLRKLNAFDRGLILDYLEKVVEKDKLQSVNLKEKLEVLNPPNGKCLHCGSSNTKKNGIYRKENLQRYLCKDCGRTHTSMTGTALHYIHRKNEFVRYVSTVRERTSLDKAADKHLICKETAHSWRHKILHSLKVAAKDNYLFGSIQSDECYIPFSEKGKPDVEKPRKRGSDRKQRGIGDELVCILTSFGNQSGESMELAGLGRLTSASVEQILGPLIRTQRKNRKLFFCTDGSKAFPAFVEKKKLLLEVVKSDNPKHKTDSGAHFQKANNRHGIFKKWLHHYNGVASKYLEGYIHLFRIINKIKNFKEPIQAMLNFVLKSRNVFVPFKNIKKFIVEKQKSLL